jgi:hypothetical protein
MNVERAAVAKYQAAMAALGPVPVPMTIEYAGAWMAIKDQLFADAGAGFPKQLSVSRSGRRYGRHIPSPMPAHRMLKRALPAGAPLYRDFRTPDQGGTGKNGSPFCGPVKDQGNQGSCTGHEKATNGEWIRRAYFKSQEIFSPAFVYSRELLMDGTFPQDEGSTGETGCLVAIRYGLCEAALDPYNDSRIVQPTPAQDANAANNKMGAYHGVSDSMTAISCLSDPVPWPVGIGFQVYESFESNETAQSGVMPIPVPGEKLLGGHQTAGCGGYDIGDVPTIRPAGCGPAILVQNSWGIPWGLAGFFWMQLPILDEQTTDVKILHSGEPWK